ncbi:hypothetical protein [Rufibacter sp. XAAS-G3-1]|uniref:hypothetical protein n=1 Tax=Rufibacter sp. XAAS-G3-1 TaxID=2729134 RepID=UPI0015E7CFEC|nr:hypothetical protein [Rufibacter sp. XAAS-G3-1]
MALPNVGNAPDLKIAGTRAQVARGKYLAHHVMAWVYYINSQQGNYSAEGRRNYHRNSLLKSAALFKGWVIDFFQERFRGPWIDQYGKPREGYVTGIFNMLWNIREVVADYKRTGKLTKIQMEHIIKLAMDVAILSVLQLLKAPWDDEEPGEKYWREKVGKLQAEVYFWMDVKGWVEMAKNPLAILGRWSSCWAR